MGSGDHLEAAMSIALRDQEATHKRWIAVTHFLCGGFGAGNGRVAADTRIDMLLRQMESELLEARTSGRDINGLFRFDLQVTLSQQWVISSYEVMRSCCQFARERRIEVPKLRAFRDLLALVRVPLVKYEIANTARKKPTIMLQPVPHFEGADNSPKPYAVDGSYRMPASVCEETGAIVWHPIDVKLGKMVAVCRRELSETFLNIDG